MGLEYLYGVQPVLGALRFRSRRIKQLLFYDNGVNLTNNPRLVQILELARQSGLPVQHTTRQQLDGLCQQRPHQNVALQVDALMVPWVEEPVGEDAWSIMLVKVIDPQNLGAIIRSAAYFDIPRMYLSDDCAPLTPVVSKASAGALEFFHPRISVCRKPNGFLDAARSLGVQLLATGAAGLPHVNIQTVPPTGKRSLLLFGNEGDGLRRSILDRCGGTVNIPVAPQIQHLGLDSLNVSVAAALIMSQIRGITSRGTS